MKTQYFLFIFLIALAGNFFPGCENAKNAKPDMEKISGKEYIRRLNRNDMPFTLSVLIKTDSLIFKNCSRIEKGNCKTRSVSLVQYEKGDRLTFHEGHKVMEIDGIYYIREDVESNSLLEEYTNKVRD